MERTKFALARGILLCVGLLRADPMPLTLHYSDPLIVVGGLGGGRFGGYLGGDPVHVYCIDFGHYFQFGKPYLVDVTPLYGDIASETRYGSIGLGSWNYANNQFTALQRYMMAAWLTTQYVPFIANWNNSNSQYQAKGIQSAIWALLDPQGVPHPPTAGNRDHWLQAAISIIGLPDYDDPTDPFYRYFRVVSPQYPTANTPQEFLIVVTPEPGSLWLLAGALACAAGARRFRVRPGN